MSNRNNRPLLPTMWILLPMSGNHYVMDFWSGFFAAEPDANASSLEDFPKMVARCLESLQYPGDTDGKPTTVSFSAGLIGAARNMLVFQNHHAQAMLYFKRIQDWHYVSLRVVYPQPISWLKVLRFLFVVLMLMLFMLVFEASGNYTMRSQYSGYWGVQPLVESRAEYVIKSVSSFFWNEPVVVLLFGIGIAIPIFILWGIFSWWRSGSFLNFLREDFQEIYRDDLASIGTAAYHAIHMAADNLSLRIFTPENSESPQPQFGAIPRSLTPSRRTPRI